MMHKILFAAVLTVAFASCATFKTYQPQQVNTAQTLRNELADSVDVAADTTALMRWQDFYGDAHLRQLIGEALENNAEMQTARLRIAEATAALRGAKGAILPSLNLAVEGNLSSFDGSPVAKTYSIGANAAWESQPLGKHRNAVRGALATVDQRKAERQMVQTQLIASVAQSYYTLQMLDKRMQVLRQTAESWQQQVAMQRALMQAGEAESGAIAQAEASYYEVMANIEQTDRQRFETEGALSALLGRMPGNIVRGDFAASGFAFGLSKHVPLAALATRPDVVKAEANLRAAFYQTNVARSAFYPSLRLTGSAGFTNNGGGIISNPASLLWQAAASLVQPLFASKQNRANLEMARAQQQQALVVFNQTLLDAANEVNNALKAYQTITHQTQLQAQQVERLSHAVGAAEAQMRYADGNALQTIIARQALLAARLQQLSSQYEQLESYITLFRSLGGGRQ